jgi:hypothetical protein
MGMLKGRNQMVGGESWGGRGGRGARAIVLQKFWPFPEQNGRIVAFREHGNQKGASQPATRTITVMFFGRLHFDISIYFVTNKV